MTETHTPAAESMESLLAEIADDFRDRLRRGEDPDVEAYARQYPAIADVLRQVLPALQVLRGSPSAAAGDGAPGGDEITGCLGDFRLIREVGRGGMGVVYEAEQLSLGRRVALKVLPFAATMDPRQLTRFHNEAKAAASLRHEHIVHVYGVGCERGVHYFAMEFIDGPPLADVIAGRAGSRERPVNEHRSATIDDPRGAHATPLAATAPVAALTTKVSGKDRAFYRRAAELIADAADALEHAHSVGIVHRDVKPGNLLLDGAGKVYVGDFGLARYGPDAGLTMSGDLLGTLRYMAPEQALARHGLADHRVDVYGLGCTLYELLTGHPAVRGEDKADILRHIAFEDPVALRKLDKAIPAELETVCLKCLAKNPNERYATAGELAADLRRFVEDKPIQAKPPGLRQRAAKWTRRHKPLVRATAVVVFALAGGLGWFARDWQARRAEAESHVAEALAAAEPRLRDGNPRDPELVSAARKAEAQLGGGVVRHEVRRQVEQLLADVTMLEKLEVIRLGQAEVKDGHFDTAGADPAYARAFREYGIDVEALGVQYAAAQIRGRAIGLHLAVALDGWALAREKAGGSDWKRLLAVAREADPDPWRCALREARASGSQADLEKLLASAPAQGLPPATLALLGTLFREDRGSAAKLVVAMLRDGQRRHPADFWINHNLAFLARFNEGPAQLDETIGFYRVALALRPQSPGVHLNLGNALQDKGRIDEAIACFREAIRLKGDYVQAHVCLGGALWNQGTPAEAERAYRTAIELLPDYKIIHRVYNDLGVALAHQGKPAEAERAFRKALELKPDYAPAYHNVAWLCWRQGKWAEAERIIRRAIEIEPDSADAHLNLGQLLYKIGRRAEAEAVGHRLIELEPNSPELMSDAGLFLRDLRLLEEAEALARKAAQRWPDDARGWQSLGAALGDQAAQGDKTKLPEAVDVLRRAVALKPDLAFAQLDLGKALILQNDVEGGIAAIKKAIGLDKSDVQVRALAASFAARACCGQGGGASLGNVERIRLRGQALDWLAAELEPVRHSLGCRAVL